MDISLIREFRDRVNKHDWVLHCYRNKDGANQWSIICSAMDWIEVCVEEIDVQKLSRKNDNQASVMMMKFINTIDVMWESIQQLHRVFFHTNSIPFKEDNSVFSDKIIQKDDNNYFKTIRSCFSAHPININEKIEPKNMNTNQFQGKERWYASWSGGTFGPKDFSVILYSNNPVRERVFFDISFDELMQFAKKRYEYLHTIMEEIDRQEQVYLQDKRTNKITKVSNPVEQIEILRHENQDRAQNDYYDYILQKLHIIFTTEITLPQNRQLVDAYRHKLEPIIQEISMGIQTMSFEEIEMEHFTELHASSGIYRYAFAKLCEFVFGDGYYLPVDWKIFKDCVGDKVDLSQWNSYDELYVLVLAGNNLEGL